MKNSVNKYLTVILSALFVFGFFIWGIIAPDKEVSVSERRTLASFPKFSSDTVFSGKFMSDFETYSLEQFPLRDSFRSIKANAVYGGLLMKDNNGIFIKDGHIFKTEYPFSEESVKRAAGIFGNIKSNLLTKDNNVYFSVIPDKNYYLGDDSGQLVIDYHKLISSVRDNMSFANYIDITDLLSLEDYYFTDSHWRQENITDVAGRLLSSMGAQNPVRNYDKLSVDTPFYGVYYGQAAVDSQADTINYLYDSYIENTKVYDYETEGYIPVYDMDKLLTTDLYEMYLSGSKSLLVMENMKADTDKELIVFRDSFGSSIAPLLLGGYRKITLVDIRYLPSAALGEYIDFNNQDILFLYSTSVLNNSITLK